MSKAEIRRVAENIAPTSFLDAREYLAAVYGELKKHFGAYSYVRFTEDMGFGSCNAMHLIIHGQRPLTSKGALKIAAALGLTGVGRKYFLKLVAAQQDENRDEAFDDLIELKTRALPTALDRRQLEFYNQWYNAAILELLSLSEATDDPAWLSSRLTPSVPPTKVANALKLLVKLGHVVKDKEKGRLVPSEAVLTTGNEVLGIAVMRYHQQMIALAKDSLTDVAPLERDISAVTIAIPAARTAELKAKIQAFRKELLEFSKACTGSDEIVQINIQLFPLARTAARSKRHED